MEGFSGNHLTGQYSVSWFFDFTLFPGHTETFLDPLKKYYVKLCSS
jgi:hypothetical protein